MLLYNINSKSSEDKINMNLSINIDLNSIIEKRISFCHNYMTNEEIYIFDNEIPFRAISGKSIIDSFVLTYPEIVDEILNEELEKQVTNLRNKISNNYNTNSGIVIMFN